MLTLVIDTNVLVSAIRSRNGYAFNLLSLVGENKFNFAVSVPLVLEFEEALNRSLVDTALNETDIESILDFLCEYGVMNMGSGLGVMCEYGVRSRSYDSSQSHSLWNNEAQSVCLFLLMYIRRSGTLSQ